MTGGAVQKQAEKTSLPSIVVATVTTSRRESQLIVDDNTPLGAITDSSGSGVLSTPTEKSNPNFKQKLNLILHIFLLTDL